MPTAQDFIEYVYGQLDSGLKPGDWVVVKRSPAHRNEGGWYGVWEPTKARLVGKIGKIVADLRTVGFDIQFPDEEDLQCLPYFVLDKIEPPVDDIRLLETCEMPSQKAVWQNAENHGWHNPSCDLPTDLLLIHSEVSEACEALRRGDMTAVEEELADVIIRILHVSEKNGFAVAAAVMMKHYKNMKRPYRHGNKKF